LAFALLAHCPVKRKPTSFIFQCRRLLAQKTGCRQEKTKLFSVKVETCLVEKILIILFHFRKKIVLAKEILHLI
jgi:hypothetical protein